jgi:nucleotide-binding universal stress UspA family protein
LSLLPSDLPIRRILVALDASNHSLAALQAAADMAAKMEAELLGLFVEDANLLQLAGLPFAREVGGVAGAARRLDAQAMERSLKAQAERSRLALAAVAEPWRLRWSFRVVRGEMAEEVLAAAYEADLVSIGKIGRQPASGGRLGPVARTVAAGAPRSVLLTKLAVPARPGVGVVYDDSVAAGKALWMAAKLAREGGGLTVLIPAPDGASGLRLEDEARQLLRSRGLTARYRWLDNSGSAVQAHLLQDEGLLVAGADSALVPVLLEELDCPVLLVR